MPTFSVGDLAQTLIFGRHGSALKTAMTRLSTEATTGLVADQTARLKGNFGQIAGIEASLNQLGAYHSVTTETQMATAMMQTALTTVAEQASALSSGLLSGVSSTSPNQINALGAESMRRLEAVVSALNTRLGDRNLFSGQATDQTPLVDADAILNSVETAVTSAGAISSADVENAVNAWFDDPGGFAALAYRGGDPLTDVPISSDQMAQVDVTAKDPALIEVFKSLTMGALLSRSVPSGDVARADLARRAGERLAASNASLAHLGARLGTVEAAIQNTATRNEAEKNVLEAARLNLLSVDPYETAAKFQETQGQLQTLYTLTARVARLRLVDFL